MFTAIGSANARAFHWSRHQLPTPCCPPNGRRERRGRNAEL